MICVFVYGTLKRGEPNFHVMSETAGKHVFVSEGRTVDTFPLVITSKYNIPCLMGIKGTGHRIYGELYDVDEEKLAVLDELEAYPALYDRKIEKIETSSGFTEAWIYMLKSWRDDIFKVSTPMMENYSSKGDHGREYVERFRDKGSEAPPTTKDPRECDKGSVDVLPMNDLFRLYARAKDMIADEDYDLYADIQGGGFSCETRELTINKAVNDLRA